MEIGTRLNRIWQLPGLHLKTLEPFKSLDVCEELPSSGPAAISRLVSFIMTDDPTAVSMDDAELEDAARSACEALTLELRGGVVVTQLRKYLTENGYDPMSRVKLRALAFALGLNWHSVAIVERQHLEHILEEAEKRSPAESPNIDISNSNNVERQSESSSRRVWTVVGFAGAGAVVFTVASLVCVPLALSATGILLKGAGATALAATTTGSASFVLGVETVAATAFGVHGATVGAQRALHRTSGYSQFQLCRLRGFKPPHPLEQQNEEGDRAMGLSVPISYRSALLRNSRMRCPSPNRAFGVAIENRRAPHNCVNGGDMVVETVVLENAEWQIEPPHNVHSGHVGVCFVAPYSNINLTYSTTIALQLRSTKVLVSLWYPGIVGSPQIGVGLSKETLSWSSQLRGFVGVEDVFVAWVLRVDSASSRSVLISIEDRVLGAARDVVQIAPINELQQFVSDLKVGGNGRAHLSVGLLNDTTSELVMIGAKAVSGTILENVAPAPTRIQAGLGAVVQCASERYSAGRRDVGCRACV